MILRGVLWNRASMLDSNFCSTTQVSEFRDACNLQPLFQNLRNGKLCEYLTALRAIPNCIKVEVVLIILLYNQMELVIAKCQLTVGSDFSLSTEGHLVNCSNMSSARDHFFAPLDMSMSSFMCVAKAEFTWSTCGSISSLQTTHP